MTPAPPDSSHIDSVLVAVPFLSKVSSTFLKIEGCLGIAPTINSTTTKNANTLMPITSGSVGMRKRCNALYPWL